MTTTVTSGIRVLDYQTPTYAIRKKNGIHTFASARDALRYVSLCFAVEALDNDPDLDAAARAAALVAPQAELKQLRKAGDEAQAAENPGPGKRKLNGKG